MNEAIGTAQSWGVLMGVIAIIGVLAALLGMALDAFVERVARGHDFDEADHRDEALEVMRGWTEKDK